MKTCRPIDNGLFTQSNGLNRIIYPVTTPSRSSASTHEQNYFLMDDEITDSIYVGNIVCLMRARNIQSRLNSMLLFFVTPCAEKIPLKCSINCNRFVYHAAEMYSSPQVRVQVQVQVLWSSSSEVSSPSPEVSSRNLSTSLPKYLSHTMTLPKSGPSKISKISSIVLIALYLLIFHQLKFY
jgi:hypothetical protein